MSPFGDELLRRAARSSPVLRETLTRHGDRPVAEYLRTLVAHRTSAVQPLHDLWDAVETEARRLHAPKVAAGAAATVRADPIVPTSNHFGLDTTAESTQSNLMFWLRQGRAAPPPQLVVFAFGSVSMNNWSYPMGLQLYDPYQGRLDRLPQRVPVLPNRVKRTAVCAAEPYDGAMLARARDRLWRMAGEGALTPFAATAAVDLIDDVLADPAVLGLPGYAEQSAAVNARLWRRIIPAGSPPSDFVQLQVERICAQLLQCDLRDPGSLGHRLLLDSQIRERLLTGLDGVRGCWQLDVLRGPADGPDSTPTGGTVFFWGISRTGRRFPLAPHGEGPNAVLTGVDDRGGRHQLPLVADDLAAALDGGQVLPSLLTCFATLAFARGLTCVGGYYQAEYLPVMRAGVVAALGDSAEHGPAAAAVAGVPVGTCLGGLQFLTRTIPDGSVIPAGPVELAGWGGITEPELDSLGSLPIREAYLLALTELFDQLTPAADVPADWRPRLAAENAGRRRRHTDHLRQQDRSQ